MTDERYPIGQFMEEDPTSEKRRAWIKAIEETPAQARKAIEGLTSGQLNTPYRDGGWNVRQVIHHLADSHINGFVRFKLALTEEEPTIRNYDEKRWAETIDATEAPMEVSLDLLDSLHKRWVYLLESLTANEFQRKFNHPERGLITLDINLQLYAWHGRHHIAHIEALRDRKGW
jgi:hypothetical protein